MDRYSKTLLTVIATALVVIAFKEVNVIPNAVAGSSGVVEVRIVDMKLSAYTPLPVQVKGEITCKGD